jgi:hypothetical protein
MTARVIESTAILGCHLKGMVCIPLKFKIAIEAVNKKESRVRMPMYMMSGLPKIKKYVMFRNISLYSTTIFPVIEGWILQLYS